MNMSAPWERQRPPEYYSASDFEKLQWVAGIPARFWNTAVSSIRPAAFQWATKQPGRTRGGSSKDEVTRVTTATQQSYLTARLEQPELLDENRLVVMTSWPTDEHALAAASLLATALIRRSVEQVTVARVRLDDIQEYEKCLSLKRDFYPTPPKFLAIHNLTPNTSRERLSLLRDLLNSNEGSYRVVVVAADNPFKFARESLYMEPDEVYHFEGRPKKKMII
jgi:hypothetical protein